MADLFLSQIFIRCSNLKNKATVTYTPTIDIPTGTQDISVKWSGDTMYFYVGGTIVSKIQGWYAYSK